MSTNQSPLNPDALKVALEWLATAVREVEVKFADDGTRPGDYWTGYREAKNEIADLLAEPELIKKATRVALAVAQPEVNSDAELHVGTLIEDKTGQQLWNVWRTGGPSVHWVDDEGRPATPVFPARVLYRPEVDE